MGGLMSNNLPSTDGELARQKAVALAGVKDALLQFCGKIEKNMQEKSYKYYSVTGDTTIKQCTSQYEKAKRDLFLTDNPDHPMTNDFHKFYTRLTDVLVQLSDDDVESICRHPLEPDKQTPAAQEFRACFEVLNEAGYYNANGRPLTFWSGSTADSEVQKIQVKLSNHDVPAVSIMAKLGEFLYAEAEKNKNPVAEQLATLMFAGSSAVFATQATGEVDLYTASHKSGDRATFIAGNFHWIAELGILQQLKQAGLVESFYIHPFLHDKNAFGAKMEIGSPEAQAILITIKGHAQTSISWGFLRAVAHKMMASISPSESPESKTRSLSDTSLSGSPPSVSRFSSDHSPPSSPSPSSLQSDSTIQIYGRIVGGAVKKAHGKIMVGKILGAIKAHRKEFTVAASTHDPVQEVHAVATASAEHHGEPVSKIVSDPAIVSSDKKGNKM
jgi:hypothetical protein